MQQQVTYKSFSVREQRDYHTHKTSARTKQPRFQKHFTSIIRNNQIERLRESTLKPYQKKIPYSSSSSSCSSILYIWWVFVLSASLYISLWASGIIVGGDNVGDNVDFLRKSNKSVFDCSC
mmetsp:Transcript_1993/g.3801  ORF Transcript_1993/g.3801 Transcript_1993/m.3801 type:complete len:121 (+) Transcript_1993:2928-3290(+)